MIVTAPALNKAHGIHSAGFQVLVEREGPPEGSIKLDVLVSLAE